MLIGVDASRAFLEERSGTENYSLELIRALLGLKEAEKHQFRLYVKKGASVDKAIEAEVVEIRLKRLWTQLGLARECLKHPPEVLFIPAHTLPVIRSKKIKTVVTIHGLEYEYLPEYYQFPQKLYLNKSTEYAVKQADRLIAVSNWTRDQLVKRLWADKKKISVVYEGIGERVVKASQQQMSGEYLRQIRYKYGLNKKYILFIGTIQPRKNLVRLIEAFSLLKLKDYDLVIGGKKGWLDEGIYQAPGRFGVTNRVKFIGRVAELDLGAVYKQAEVFVWPSLMEGFGLPVLEAQTMGLPVITSNAGALPEVVKNTALQIEPKDVNGLANAINLVLTSRELKEGLIEKGYANVRRFSWEKAAQKTLKILTEW